MSDNKRHSRMLSASSSSQDQSRASKRSSRSISNFSTSKPSVPRRGFGQGFIPVTKTYSSPLMSIGTSRLNLGRRETDSEMIASFREIKSECFQWGAGKKILEKPKVLRGKNIKSVQCGGSHTLALLDNGDVYSWGDGRCGQLSLGNKIKETEQPLRISIPEPIEEIFAGFTQSAFISKTGKLYIAGLIGRDIKFEAENCPAFDNVKIMGIAFGPSCISILGCPIRLNVLTKEESLAPSVIWVWGHSRQGHLGMGDRTNILEPCELEALSTENVSQISAGEHHMCALTEDHRIFIWGTCPANGTGQEGPLLTPTAVLGFEMKKPVKVICGNKCTFVLTEKGHVYSWGNGNYGVLGHGNTETYEFPGMINFFAGKTIVGIDSGGNHACAWTSDGRVYSWGAGRHFALGHTDGEDRTTPHLIEALADGKILLQLNCGSSETVVLVERDIIEINYNGQTSRLPVHNYPFVGHVIRKLAAHHKKRVEDLFLLDESGNELGAGASIRDIKSESNKVLKLVSKPSMYDYAEKSLFFLSPDAERIKNGCDAIPQVKGGTIHKLIEWLTFPKPTGHEFASTFLLTYRTFMTSEELLEELIKRYANPIVQTDKIESLNLSSYSSQSKEAKQHIIQLRVFNTMKRWLTSHADNFIGYDPTPVIRVIEEFIQSEVYNVHEKFERESGNILRILDQLTNKEESIYVIEKFREGECVPRANPCHNGAWDIFKYPADEIARQITLIDYFLFFRKIQPGELIGQAWSKSKKESQAPNVLNMIHRFNDVSEWVAKVILTGRTQAMRTASAERIIDIAHELFKLNSFNSVMSILSAFNSSALHRLKSVWEPKNGGISQASAEKLKKLQSSLSVEKNMVSYRDLFDALPPPKIPFLGKYLQDLTFIDDGNPDYLDETETLINFDKRLKLASIISVIQQLQKDPYCFVSIPECIEALQNISGFENHDSVTYSISKFIERKTGEITNDISDIDNPIIRDMLYETTVPSITRKRVGTMKNHPSPSSSP